MFFFHSVSHILSAVSHTPCNWIDFLRNVLVSYDDTLLTSLARPCDRRAFIRHLPEVQSTERTFYRALRGQEAGTFVTKNNLQF